MLEHGQAHAAGANDADACPGLSVCHINLDCVAMGRMCQFLGTNRGLGGRGRKEERKHGGPVRSSLALQCLTRQCLTRLAGVAAVLALAAPASAQVSLLSREVQGAMTATGAIWNHSLRPDLSEMREAFAALHAVATKDRVVVTT